LKKQLKSLDTNKTVGPDNVHPHLLKEAAHETAPELTLLFQLSLDCKKKSPSNQNYHSFRKGIDPKQEIIELSASGLLLQKS